MAGDPSEGPKSGESAPDGDLANRGARLALGGGMQQDARRGAEAGNPRRSRHVGARSAARCNILGGRPRASFYFQRERSIP